ncbi:hypothetical protein T4E_9648 [Trichinella pseudospiralis]|uniref:Uncharacterized protein n=1 Tax=Trichinella pseudospiralis TaxID=6337 RepID=A0A0V0YKU1_TRIPS|nr:hypothetical protein T4E_9648 [Trichinella pseudospiralis]
MQNFDVPLFAAVFECMLVVVKMSLQSSIFDVPVAQWIARWASNSKAVGSIPTRDGFFESMLKHLYKNENVR